MNLREAIEKAPSPEPIRMRSEEEARLDHWHRFLSHTFIKLRTLLHEKKLRSNFSRSDIARALGKDKSYVSRILNGRYNVTIKSLVEIAYVAGYDVTVNFAPRGNEQLFVQTAHVAKLPAAASTRNVSTKPTTVRHWGYGGQLLVGLPKPSLEPIGSRPIRSRIPPVQNLSNSHRVAS